MNHPSTAGSSKGKTWADAGTVVFGLLLVSDKGLCVVVQAAGAVLDNACRELNHPQGFSPGFILLALR